MRSTAWTAGVVAAVSLAVFFYGNFWLRGARFHDCDYTVWLPKAAEEEPFQAAVQIFAPPFKEWGFWHRPVEVLLTRILLLREDLRPGVCFVAKTIFWSVLTALMGWLAAAATGSLGPPIALCLTLAASAPLFASVLDYGDFTVLSHLFLAGATAFLLVHMHLAERWKFRLRLGLQAGVFLCYLLALNTKGSARMFLPALACFVLLRGWREGLRPYGILLLAMLAVSVPWGVLPHDPLPPFFPGAAPRGPELWQPWSAARWCGMLFGGVRGLGAPMEEMGNPPSSVMGAYLPWFALGALLLTVNGALKLAGTRRGVAPQTVGARPAERALMQIWGFWALWVLIGLGSVPDGGKFDRTRFLAELGTPLNGLAILAFHRLCQPFGRERFRAAALFAVTILYALPNLYFTAVLRETEGVARVAINQVQTYVHQDLKFGAVFFADFPDDPRAFYPRNKTNLFYTIDIERLRDPASLPGGQEAYVVTRLDLSNDSRYQRLYEASGNSYTLYDRLFNTAERTGKGDRHFVYQIDPALRADRDLFGKRSESIR